MALPAAASVPSVGHYQLIVELGKSPLGALWAARGPGDALFFLRRLLAADVPAPGMDRLMAALPAASRLVHSNIARVCEIIREGEAVAIASELTHGEPLRALLRLSNFLRRPFPVPVALKIGRDLLLALAYAESRGLSAIGGIGPDTVLVGQNGSAVILEASLAGQLQRDGVGGDSVDTLAYLSPESFSGTVSQASDMFSVGVLLWEMLTGGRRLFAGATRQAVLARIESLEIAELSGFKLPGGKAISPAVSQLVARALARDSTRRFGTFSEMISALDACESALNPDAVRDFLKELAGNALTARETLIGRSSAAPKSLTPTPAPAHVQASAPVAALEAPAVSAASPLPPVLPPARPPALPSHKRRTLLGMAPPKPADVLRASAMVSHAEPDAVEPSIAAGPVAERNPQLDSEGRMAAELLHALAKEPSSSLASPEPFAAPSASAGAQKEEDTTQPLSPERLAEIITAVGAQASKDAADAETTDVERPTSENQMLGSLVREALNATPVEEGHTEQTKLSRGVTTGAAEKPQLPPPARSLRWPLRAVGAVCLVSFAGYILTPSSTPPAAKENLKRQESSDPKTTGVASVPTPTPALAPQPEPAPEPQPESKPERLREPTARLREPPLPPARVAPVVPSKPSVRPKPTVSKPSRSPDPVRPKARVKPAAKADFTPSDI